MTYEQFRKFVEAEVELRDIRRCSNFVAIASFGLGQSEIKMFQVATCAMRVNLTIFPSRRSVDIMKTASSRGAKWCGQKIKRGDSPGFHLRQNTFENSVWTSYGHVMPSSIEILQAQIKYLATSPRTHSLH